VIGIQCASPQIGGSVRFGEDVERLDIA